MDHRHPQQKVPSPSCSFSAAFHFASLTTLITSYSILLKSSQADALKGAYGGFSIFLTLIGLGLSVLTFATAFVADLFHSLVLFETKNALSTLATPLEILISTLYWGFILINPGLVMFGDDDIQISLAVDLGLHVFPAVLLTIDAFFLSPPWTITAGRSMSMSLLLALGYWLWTERCYSFNGWYPYPIFEILSKTQRMGLFCFSALMLTGFCVLLKRSYHWVNKPINAP